jgi:hypothetical protein
MKKFGRDEGNGITRVFNFSIYILDYVYKEISAIPKDFLTEIHLRYYKQNKNPKKKILGYWDFNQRLGRLGDFLVFLQNLNVYRNKFNLDLNQKNIDICFIENDEHYNASQVRFSKPYEFKRNLKNLVVTNPHIDSILTFKSNKEFDRYYQQNKDRYIRWPPTVASSVAFDCNQVEKFYDEKGFIPYLDMPQGIKQKIYRFYEKHVNPALPVIINIRNNKGRSNHRNSDISEYFKFLKKYESNNKFKFIVICSKPEIPQELRSLSNVIISKDYFEGIEYDLGFIKTSYLSIFPGSGMSIMAWHGNVPFIGLGPYDYEEIHTSPLKEREFRYHKKYQKFYHEPHVTTELLVSSFEDILHNLEKNNVNNFENNKVKNEKIFDAN